MDYSMFAMNNINPKKDLGLPMSMIPKSSSRYIWSSSYHQKNIINIDS